MGNAHSTHDSSSVVSEKPTGYPTSIRSTRNNKKPQPFFNEAFFDRHLSPAAVAAQQQQQQIRKLKPAGHVNFFEVAAATAQPSKNSSKSSSHTNSSASSLKTASTHTNNNKSYPSTINTHSQRAAKRLNSTTSSLNSQTSSTTSNTAVEKTKPEEDPEYVTLNGRKYWKGHGSQTFILPCDDDENDRLMTMHYILKSALHGNFISPIQYILESETKKAKVLDIGCGSGTWILEMATEFPNTEFYGVDDCPLFPTSIKPANSHFKLHNVLKGLPFEDNEFDFVYMRLMVLYFTPEELAHLLKEISRVMKPGGYFEVVDTNYNIRSPGPISHKIVNSEIKKLLHMAEDTLVQTYESNTNHPIFTFLMLAPQHASGSFNVNFIDICQEHTTLPLGGWGGGQIGNLHGENFQKLLSSLQYKLPTTENSLDETMEKVLSLEETSRPCLPLPKSSIQTIIEECEQHKSYLDWFACYARKPFDDDQLEQSTLDSIYEFVEGFVDV